jgi:hypothetical protein
MKKGAQIQALSKHTNLPVTHIQQLNYLILVCPTKQMSATGLIMEPFHQLLVGQNIQTRKQCFQMLVQVAKSTLTLSCANTLDFIFYKD